MEKVLMDEDRRSPNVSEKPINVQVVEPFIKAGISHHFRHLAACEPIDNGVSPEVVGEFLGHSDIKSILVYSPDSRAKNFRKRSEALTKVKRTILSTRHTMANRSVGFEMFLSLRVWRL